MRTPIQTLETERLVLRPPVPGDAAWIGRVCRPIDVARNTLHIPHPYPADGAEKWLSDALPAISRRERYSWAVTLRDGAEPGWEGVGLVGLHPEWDHLHAELGYVIGMPWWGRGYATEAVRAVVRFVFTRTELIRLHAGHYARNPASGRVLEKCGFVREGLRPRMYRRFGEWVDLVQMRLLREEWEARPDDVR